MSDELEHIWSRAHLEMARAVGEETFRIWLEPLKARRLTAERLTIEVPAAAHGWVRDRFGAVIAACVERAMGAQVEIELVSPGPLAAGIEGTAARGAGERAGTSRAGGGARRQSKEGEQEGGSLPNPKLTFDQFVIGDCNRLAHAAALTVAEMPSAAYNPLFICGPPGVGKTHLLNSIASLLLAHDPSLVVRVTTGEAFTNEFLGALSDRQTDAFKTRFRDVDVLLVDDVQFLERKARTEEEFFHTFNALYDGGRQIVLSSDRPPRDLQALEDRLRERFGSGLVADIQPPDLPTRMTILRKRAQHDHLVLEDESPLRAIAEHVHDNVRAIEGALIRVVAFSSLTGRPITRELACEVLDSLYPDATSRRGRGGRPSIAEIASAACAHFGVTTEEIMSTSRARRIAWPRQVAMYLARELTAESLPSIGRAFGGRDHTTVLHAHRRTAARIASDTSSRAAVDSLRGELRVQRINPGHDRSK